jgi:SAM-dependent methyltransferase
LEVPGGAAQRDDWDQHWDNYAAAAEQNPAQRYRRKLVFDLLELGGGSRVLDIGSGQGDFAAELLQRHPGADLLGIEVSPAGIEISQRKAPSASFIVRDLMDPEPPPEDYRDWATHAVCSEVLEHVDDPGRVIANSLPYMQPGCRLVVTVPAGPMSAFDRHIGHRRHFSPADLRNLLHGAGFEVEMSGGAGFPFFNLYRLAVVLGGRRLVSVGDGVSESPSANAAMATFRTLFKLNLPIMRGGWQTVAVARRPAAAGGG